MKKHIALLIIVIGIISNTSAQDYPKSLTEFGFNLGVLNRHYGNVDQGTDEDGYPAYRLAINFQQREGVFLLDRQHTFEFSGYNNDLFYNCSIGRGLAIFKNKLIRLDGLVYLGLDFSKSIGAPWFRPSLSYNFSIYYQDLRISLTGRGSMGILESYGESGITVGYFFRRKTFGFQ